MKFSFSVANHLVTFRITDFDPKYIPVFEMCFYQPQENAYQKTFPADLPNLEQIKSYYAAHAQEMFNQLGYFAPIPWQDALCFFLERVQSTSIRWWLTGSCAACIRGIDLNPHDVDIMVDSRDIPQIEECFADVIIEPIINTQGWLTKDFGVLFAHARIDIASDPVAALDDPEPLDCGPYAQAHLEQVNWRGFDIPVPPLSLQIAVNRKRERWERVQRMQAWLDQMQSIEPK